MAASAAVRFLGSNGDKDYDDKDAGSNGKLVDGLTEISASVTSLCIQIGGMSKNLVTPNFYENHSFLNLIQTMLIEQKYIIDEAIRTLDGWAIDNLDDIVEKSKIGKSPKGIRDPKEIVKYLIPQFKIIVDLSSKNWQLAVKSVNPAIVGVNIGLSQKFTHFLWELESIAGKYKD